MATASKFQKLFDLLRQNAKTRAGAAETAQ